VVRVTSGTKEGSKKRGFFGKGKATRQKPIECRKKVEPLKYEQPERPNDIFRGKKEAVGLVLEAEHRKCLQWGGRSSQGFGWEFCNKGG